MSLATKFVRIMDKRLNKGEPWKPQQQAAKLEGISMVTAKARNMFQDIGDGNWRYTFSDRSVAVVRSYIRENAAWVPKE